MKANEKKVKMNDQTFEEVEGACILANTKEACQMGD